MKIVIVGHFGFGKNLLNGQTVKTVNLSKGLKRYSDFEIYEIDTYNWIRHPLNLFLKLKRTVEYCDVAVMLPAHNGVRVFAPILVHFKRKFRKKIFYDVIGGWLPDFLTNRPKLIETLKAFDGIWVETETMRKKLIKLNFENTSIVPNFKEITPLKESELYFPKVIPYKLCTFSRVMKQKGIEDAINAVKTVNEKHNKIIYTLDIYGQIDDSYLQRFEQIKLDFPEYIRYAGIVQHDKTVEVLKYYFALLFPTYYIGEGFAGTLIDAYSAGLPIIATDWNYNAEIISENVGLVYPTGQKEKLVYILDMAYNDPKFFLSKKVSCLQEAEKYRSEIIIYELCQKMK